MNKSEAYRMAIEAVIKDRDIDVDETIDILNVLFSDYNTAKWSEKREKEAQA